MQFANFWRSASQIFWFHFRQVQAGGDQILNARSFERQGFSIVLEEESITNETLLDGIHRLYKNRDTYKKAMSDSGMQNSIETIINLIVQASQK